MASQLAIDNNRLRQRNRYLTRKAAGNCVQCGKGPATEGEMCLGCREKHRQHHKTAYDKKAVASRPVRFVFEAGTGL